MRITAFPERRDFDSGSLTMLCFGGWRLNQGEETGCRLFVQRRDLRVQGKEVVVSGDAYIQTGPSQYRRVGRLEGAYPGSGQAPVQADFTFTKGD